MNIDHQAVKEGATHWSPKEPDGSRVEAYWKPSGKGGYDCFAIASFPGANEWQHNNCELPPYAMPIPFKVTPAWNGEGLPPVGAVCEWKEKTGFSWVKATVLFITGSSVVMQREDGFEWQMMTARDVFRPFRTSEQIAKEARSKACDKMYGVILDRIPPERRNNGSDICEALYDAGYRKLANPTSE